MIKKVYKSALKKKKKKACENERKTVAIALIHRKVQCVCVWNKNTVEESAGCTEMHIKN